MMYFNLTFFSFFSPAYKRVLINNGRSYPSVPTYKHFTRNVFLIRVQSITVAYSLFLLFFILSFSHQQCIDFYIFQNVIHYLLFVKPPPNLTLNSFPFCFLLLLHLKAHSLLHPVSKTSRALENSVCQGH